MLNLHTCRATYNMTQLGSTNTTLCYSMPYCFGEDNILRNNLETDVNIIKKMVYDNIRARAMKRVNMIEDHINPKESMERHREMSLALVNLREHAKTRNYRREIHDKSMNIKYISGKNIDPEIINPKGMSKTTDNGIFSTCTWQQDSRQDFTWMNPEKGYILVCDGHGDNSFINWLRNTVTDADLNEAFDTDCPVRYIETLLTFSMLDTENSGGCITTMKITPTSIMVSSIGDSQARIYINNELVEVTDEHSGFNPVEVERKKKDGAIIKDELMLKCLEPGPSGELRLTKSLGKRITHNPTALSCKHDRCQVSRAAGHAYPGLYSNTGTNIYRKTVYFDEADEVIAISGSDGIWDLVHEDEDVSHYKNASKITVDYCNKWYSVCDFVHFEGHNCKLCREKRENNIEGPVVTKCNGILADDICAGVWYRPVVNPY